MIDPAKKTSIIVKRSTENFLRFYCVFVCTLLSLNVLRYLPSFWVGIDFIPNLTSLRIITLLFYLQNAIVSIVLFIFYDNRNHFESYVKQYIDAVEDQISKSLMLNPKSNRIDHLYQDSHCNRLSHFSIHNPQEKAYTLKGKKYMFKYNVITFVH